MDEPLDDSKLQGIGMSHLEGEVDIPHSSLRYAPGLHMNFWYGVWNSDNHRIDVVVGAVTM